MTQFYQQLFVVEMQNALRMLIYFSESREYPTYIHI